MGRMRELPSELTAFRNAFAISKRSARNRRQLIMSFPVTVEKTRLEHNAGTKAYFIVVITTSSGRSLVINRWGKVGTWGQMKVERFEKILDAKKTAALKHGQKIGNGYILEKTEKRTAENEDDLKRVLGSYWPYMGRDNLLWLELDVDVSEVRDPVSTEWEKKNGRYVPKDPKRRMIEEPEKSVEEKIADNSNWGMF